MRAVVSFANNKFYQDKMKRLQDSVESQGVKFIGYKSFEEVGSPPHSQVPYAFKPYSIWKAIEQGYETILWLDSPICAIGDLSPVFEYIERNGFMFFNNSGHPLGKWSHDKALAHFGKTREEAMEIKQIMACAMGFCVDPKHGNSFSVRELLLRPYKDLAADLFPGSWDNSRHDQMTMSFLINKHGFDILEGHETFFIYTHFRNVFTISPTVCLESK